MLNIMSFYWVVIIWFQYMLESAEAVIDNLSIQVENNALDLHEQVIFFYFFFTFPSSNDVSFGQGKIMERAKAIADNSPSIRTLFDNSYFILLRIAGKDNGGSCWCFWDRIWDSCRFWWSGIHQILLAFSYQLLVKIFVTRVLTHTDWYWWSQPEDFLAVIWRHCCAPRHC